MARKHKGVVRELEGRFSAFAFAFMSIFVISFIFLAWVGATPNPPATDSQTSSETTVMTSQTSATSSSPESPVRVVAKDIDLDVTVSNPTTIDIDVLDQALLVGAVRYPTSAELGVDGTVLLFGHSSYLPIVHNQAYKTFDGIQNLKTGDIVSVYSSAHEYRYQVTGMRVADAEGDSVELSTSGKHLTLVTCDSFASKNHRFVVTADYVGAYTR